MGPTGSLPYLDSIQHSFGHHDVSSIEAHVGGPAAQASQAMGAEAYATGNRVAFRDAPSLHTAAHEAAHVVQQRAGVQLGDGVGRGGDAYERHADSVADRVASGQSAQDLLDQFGGSGGSPAVQRSEEATTAEEAAAVAPDGPLQQLRDELDDTFVDEDECLRLIGLLGPGERQLVARDHTMMQQMADAFDADEMLTAVDRLGCELKWAVYWLDKAGEAGSIGDAGYARLIGSASQDQIAEMVGWEQVRAIVEANYQASPLALPALRTDPAKMQHVIGAHAAFSDWVLRVAAAEAYVHYAAHNDPAAVLAALRTASRLSNVVQAARTAGITAALGNDLFELFKATTVAEERRLIFSVRFGERASGDFDWIADGEAHWNQRLQIAGEGQSDTQIAADIAAGNAPGTVADAVAGDPGGPLEQLRDELDDTFVDEEACLGNIAALAAAERYLVRSDNTLMTQMAGAFNAEELVTALRHLAFPEPKDAVHWLDQAGVAGSVERAQYEQLIFGASAQAVANLIGWRAAFDLVKEHAGIDPLGMPPLVTNDPMFAHVVSTYGYYGDWVLETPGAQMLVRYIAQHSPALTTPALDAGGKLESTVAALPVGTALAPVDKQALFEMHKHLPDMPDKILLFERRFNVTVGTEGGASAFEDTGFQRIWELLDTLPESTVAGNDWLDAVHRRTNPSAPTPQGVAGTRGGTNRLAVGYDPAQINTTDTGEFTDAGDVMRGGVIFDDVVVHELGHALDNVHNYSGDGGPLATRADLGAWRQYRNTSDAEAQVLLDDMKGLASLTGLTPAQTANAEAALLSAIRQQDADPLTAFQRQGTAAGEAWSAGNSWFDLWSAVSGHALITALRDGHLGNTAWNNPPAALGGRVFHQAYSNRWASYLAAVRGGQKLSRYQFRTRGEFFAEIHAVYYATPNDPGARVQAWNRVVYDWFTRDVDRGYSTRAQPEP